MNSAAASNPPARNVSRDMNKSTTGPLPSRLSKNSGPGPLRVVLRVQQIRFGRSEGVGGEDGIRTHDTALDRITV